MFSKLSSTLALMLAITGASYGQNNTQRVFTSDVDNFWKAYDMSLSTTDSLKQLNYIQTLYVDKASEGLKAFMVARDYSAPLWVKLIRKYPKFWNSIRANTLSVKSKGKEIDKSILRFQQLYPELKEAKMYFTVGGLRSGGTVKGNMVLIGTEIATGTPSTNVTEFESSWLPNVFKVQSLDNLVSLNIHEYVHTQQRGSSYDVLSKCISEGSCDFIAELVMGKPLKAVYIDYGLAHQAEVARAFEQDMFSNAYNRWLYNGSTTKTVVDLGYFMGYAICKSYYKNAADKQKAIKDIIELDYSDSNKVEDFLTRSGYYPKGFDKTTLLAALENKKPTVSKLEPFKNGDQDVDPGLKQMKIIFSEVMSTERYSFDLGEKGKNHFPLGTPGKFSEDKMGITLNLDLKPNQEYQFVVTGRGFKSDEGYALKPYVISFKTRAQ